MQLHEKRKKGYFVKKLLCKTFPLVTEVYSENAIINSFLPQETNQ